MISLTDSQKIGMGLTGFGVFFLFFGMILFFDKALLAIGNILFVVGLAFVIGLERTFRFFFQRHKLKASSLFLGGVLIVLIGWPIIGVLLELYGFFLLFRGLLPGGGGLHQEDPCAGGPAQPALHQLEHRGVTTAAASFTCTWTGWRRAARWYSSPPSTTGTTDTCYTVHTTAPPCERHWPLQPLCQTLELLTPNFIEWFLPNKEIVLVYRCRCCRSGTKCHVLALCHVPLCRHGSALEP